MKLYANCNRVFNQNEIILRSETGKIYFSIKHIFLKKITGLKIYNEKQKEVYRINYNPLKFKNRYIITNTHNHPVIQISVGKKLIHSLEYNHHHYICKGSFLKMKYRLYDKDDELVTISVIKKGKEKYFEIIQDDNGDIMLALSMLIVAQTIKDRVWFIYGL